MQLHSRTGFALKLAPEDDLAFSCRSFLAEHVSGRSAAAATEPLMDNDYHTWSIDACKQAKVATHLQMYA